MFSSTSHSEPVSDCDFSRLLIFRRRLACRISMRAGLDDFADSVQDYGDFSVPPYYYGMYDDRNSGPDSDTH